jgi:hypothetical protein
MSIFVRVPSDRLLFSFHFFLLVGSRLSPAASVLKGDMVITSYRCHTFTVLRGGTIIVGIGELLGRQVGMSSQGYTWAAQKRGTKNKKRLSFQP